ncbi:MAG: Holliday junction branch migration protein RuvA [Candidatus Paceibacterota bacterium]
MIGQLKGDISYKDERFVILNVGGVGYKIFLTPETTQNLSEGKTASFWTHLVVREEVLDLYGFLTKTELDFFGLLIGISGVGPKSALSILSLAPPETLKKAVSAGDSSYLTQVSGIGRKIAEKIILELKDKIIALVGENPQDDLTQETEALQALEMLGYSPREAREALRQIPTEITSTEDKVKSALKNLHHK